MSKIRFGVRDFGLGRALTAAFHGVRNAVQRGDGGERLTTPEAIADALSAGYGDNVTGARVTDTSALRVAAVYACVALLSRAQAMLLLQLFKLNGENQVLEVKHPVAKVLRQPNGWQTAYEFESMMTAHKALRGNAYALIVRDGKKPVMLVPLNPSRMQVTQDDSLRLRYKYALPDGRTRIFAQEEIHHRRSLCTDGFVGLSPIEAARLSIGMAMQTQAYGGALFRNAATPSGVLKHPKTLSEEAIKRLRDQFAEDHEGAGNAHKSLVLEEGMEWVKIGMTAEDSQFIESRKFERNEIAMFYGVPPHMIGDIERGTSWGSGIEQQSLGFLVHTLMPHLINDQQALARDLLSDEERADFVVRHDTAILTRAEFATRQSGLQIQLQNGVINPNEWRKIEGLNPRKDPGGEEYRTGGSAPDPDQRDEGEDAAEDDGDEVAEARRARRRSDRRDAA